MEIPAWSLPLGKPIEILTAGWSKVGRLKREIYHPHPHWQIGFFEGTTKVIIDGIEGCWTLDIDPGHLFIIPPGMQRRYESNRPFHHYYLSFYFRENHEVSHQESIPALIPVGAMANRFCNDFADIIDLQEVDPYESELVARLLLWRLRRISKAVNTSLRGGAKAVQSSLEQIRVGISDPNLSPQSIAQVTDLSRRRLDQLFVKYVGKAVGACIRDRRIEIASALLLQTDLPVKEIGAQVGIPDPQGFNKFMHRQTGYSPNQLRRK